MILLVGAGLVDKGRGGACFVVVEAEGTAWVVLVCWDWGCLVDEGGGAAIERRGGGGVGLGFRFDSG